MIDPFEMEDDWPDGQDHRRQWARGYAWCSQHEGWVPLTEAHRQFNTPCATWVCRDCFLVDDLKEKRAAPEARVDVKPTRLPPVLANLWTDLEEAE